MVPLSLSPLLLSALASAVLLSLLSLLSPPVLSDSLSEPPSSFALAPLLTSDLTNARQIRITSV